MNTAFKTESGIEFLYDNKTNALLELDGSAVFTSVIDTDYEAFAKATYATTKKHNKPVAIRLLMGHACNYSCVYCLQKDIGNPNERAKSSKLDKLINSIEENMDLSNLSRFELWGGEPFLYWNDMVGLITHFDKEGIEFGITTNGSMLSQKHVDFFKSLKGQILLTISHDAKQQRSLRGEDPFEQLKVINAMKELGKVPNLRYGFLCSLTNTNFDLFEINDFFRDKIMEHGLSTNSLSFSLGRTYQEKTAYAPSESLSCQVDDAKDESKAAPKSESYTHVIHGENLEKFQKILAHYLEQHHTQMVDSTENGEPTIFGKSAKDTPLLMCDIYESSIAYSVTEVASKMLKGERVLESTNCGADNADIISMGMDGAIRTCPHSGKSHIFGHINNIKGAHISALDFERRVGDCDNCEVRLLCKSGCPIKFPDETFMTNCRIEKIWYGEIQKAAFRLILNSPVNKQ